MLFGSQALQEGDGGTWIMGEELMDSSGHSGR
jgi:hypothetical protein